MAFPPHRATAFLALKPAGCPSPPCASLLLPAGPSTSSSTKLAAAAAVAAQPAPDEAADSEPLIKAAYPGRVSTQQAPDSSNSVINSPRGAPAELPQLQPRRPPPPPPAAHSNAAARPRQVAAAAGVQPFRFERLG